MKVETFDPSSKDDIQYGVFVPGFHTSTSQANGDVMSRETWLNAVKCGMFIDYDGYGRGILEGGTLIQSVVVPSKANELDSRVEWIVWYNR